MGVIVPHFDLPFRFTGGYDKKVAVAEQGSVEDLANCVYTIVVCPRGWRDEVPDFGIPDPTFGYPGLPEALRGSIQDQEPRSVLSFEDIESRDALMAAVRIGVARRGGA